MNKELQAILPGFGKAIEPHLWRYLTSNKEASTRSALFMAGSPAAGKTELLNNLFEESEIANIVRIDADDFRWWFPYYNEENAIDYQSPASEMVEFVYQNALLEGYQVAMDSTFASQTIAEKNFERAFKAGYSVLLNYVYFDPELAWSYAQLRTRKVPLNILKANFFKCRATIVRMLKKYPGRFTLNVYHRRVDPDNAGKFLIDYVPDVTLETWQSSHDCPYASVSDLAYIEA